MCSIYSNKRIEIRKNSEERECFFFLPKCFVVKIGFDGDVGDGKVECSLEDIK